MNGYTPPYTITDQMLSVVSRISTVLGRLEPIGDLGTFPRLRRINRIRSIRSSLAIEQNSLSAEQVSDILDGKRVLGPPDEILEVKNAIEAYRQLDSVDPFSMEDLLRVHGTMMKGLTEEYGTFRKGAEGVFEGGRCIHLAPPADRVPGLMSSLFDWRGRSGTHPLIGSSVFHYELEFIHPFSDGNGRIGRFWQTAILKEWNPLFTWIPVEDIILERQDEYYGAIADSASEGSSNRFIIFMLGAFKDAVEDLAEDSRGHAGHPSIYVRRLMDVIQDRPLSATELMDLLGLRSKASFRNNYLVPALESGLIEMTEPERPTSRNQMYVRRP